MCVCMWGVCVCTRVRACVYVGGWGREREEERDLLKTKRQHSKQGPHSSRLF